MKKQVSEITRIDSEIRLSCLFARVFFLCFFRSLFVRPLSLQRESLQFSSYPATMGTAASRKYLTKEKCQNQGGSLFQPGSRDRAVRWINFATPKKWICTGKWSTWITTWRRCWQLLQTGFEEGRVRKIERERGWRGGRVMGGDWWGWV